MTNTKHHYLWRGPILAVVVTAAIVVILGVGRSYLAYGAESDFLWTFLPDAERLLSGQPLQCEFHPPLFSILVGMLRLAVSDWMTAGLLLSGLSALAALAANFYAFRELCGGRYGWWAVAGLMCSPAYWIAATQVTSDALFLASYSIMVAAAVVAWKRKSGPWWFLCGLMAAATILTRTNGVVALLVLVVPLLQGARNLWSVRVRHSLLMLVGFALPIAAWIFFASSSGSALWPAQLGQNLATTYFSGGAGRLSLEALEVGQTRFGASTVLGVLAQDPALVLRTYLRDLYTLMHGLQWLLGVPLRFLVWAGLVALVLSQARRSRPLSFYLAFALVHVLFVNLHAFSPRYVLFLVPLFGVGVGALIDVLRVPLADESRWRTVARVVLILALMMAATEGVARAYRNGHTADGELGEAAPFCQSLVRADDMVVARKPHVAFYTGCAQVNFPSVQSLAELRELLAGATDSSRVYVYMGKVERLMRPEIAWELETSKPPEWLYPMRPGPLGDGTDSSSKMEWQLFLVEGP